MYDINRINIGEQLKYYRKASNKTMLEIGQSINKSKATISKYERNEIIPDSITLLELCNCLGISLNELFSSENTNVKIYNNDNPFGTDKLYVYYYTDKKLMTSIIDIFSEDSILKCRFFNGIKNIKSYKNCAYYYEGIIETNKTIAYFILNNVSAQNNMLEKVQIIVNISWSNEISICKGIIVGLTPSALPIVKKIIISTSEINDINKYNEALIFSKDDVKKIYYDNALIIEKKNYDEFFFDF